MAFHITCARGNPRCTPAYPKCPSTPVCARCGRDGNDVEHAAFIGQRNGRDRFLCAECLPLAEAEYDTPNCVREPWADGETFGV